MTDDGFFTDDFVEEDAHWFAAGGALRRNGVCPPADRVVQQRRGAPRPGGRLRLSHLPQQGLSPRGDRRGGHPKRLDAALPVPEGPPEHPAGYSTSSRTTPSPSSRPRSLGSRSSRPPPRPTPRAWRAGSSSAGSPAAGRRISAPPSAARPCTRAGRCATCSGGTT